MTLRTLHSARHPPHSAGDWTLVLALLFSNWLTLNKLFNRFMPQSPHPLKKNGG